MGLQELWFIAVAVLFVGFFVLEGFDFGVGMLVPVVGKAGAVRVPNYERIVGLSPDVVFVISTDPSEPDLLQRKLRVPVIALSQGQPAFDSELFLESILLAGSILGREERAHELVTGVRALATRLPAPAEEAMAQAYVGGLSYRGNQDIKSTAADFLPFTLAGVKNMADGMGRSGHFFINREFLLAANPPLIFIDGNGLPLIRQALDSERVRSGLKAILLGPAQLYEVLRERGGNRFNAQ